jgi:hypothetical protein
VKALPAPLRSVGRVTLCRHLSTCSVAVLALLLVAPPGLAAAPRNDKFAKARQIRVGSQTVATTVHATRERFEPALGQSGSVWYRLRAPANGDISINTCATRADITLGAYTGSSVKSLSAIAEDDVSGCPGRGGFFGSHVRFTAQAGATYRISVTAYRGAGGRFQLVATSIATPANDAFASARSLRVGKRAIQSTELASAEANEPRHAGRPATKSLWFRFRAPRTGRFRLTTEASSFDTLLAVYRGNSLTGLHKVAANDDANKRTVSSGLTFRATKGVVYRIALDGFKSSHAGGSGDGVVTLNRA